MKILVVVPDTDMGGITTSVYNFTAELSKRGNDVTFLDFSAKQKNENVDIRAEQIFLKGISKYWKLTNKDASAQKGFKKIFLKLLGLFKKLTNKNGLWNSLIFKKLKGEYDIAIAFRQCAPCYSFVLDKVKAKKKIGFVHGELKFMGDISSWKKYMVSFDKIAYVSNAVKEEFIKEYPELNANASAVYNMFDSQKIKELSKCENPLSFKKGVKNIVTVARIDNAFKRIDLIPQICKELKTKTDIPFHWYVIGDGPDYDDVRSLIKEYEVEDIVTLAGAFSNPFAILKDANFSVLLSKSEAYPMTVIESFILGVPIVVSRFATIEEMMQNEKHGLIAEQGVEDITEKILVFLENGKLLDSCKEFLSKEKYNNDKEYEQFLKAIGDL